MAERSERSDSRGSDKRRRGRPVDYTNHSVGRIVEDSWQQDYVIPLCSVSAKTRLSPPITYWEKSLDAEMRRGGIDSRQNSVWKNIKFTLNLRTTKVNHFRFLNLHCEPLPPLGYPPDGMNISLSLEPGREEAMLIQYGKTHGGNSVDLRLFSGGTCRTYTKNSPAGSIYRWTAILVNLRDALHQADGMMDLRLMLEKEDDMEMLRSFLAAAASNHRGVANNNRKSSEIQVPVEPQYMRLHQGSDAQLTKPIIPEHSPVIIEHRPPRPQTNPNLDPRIYDPFPGIPIPLGKPGSYRATEDNARRTKDTNISSESPAQTSQMLAAMELSDGGVEGSLIGASLESQNGGDTVLTQSSSEEWSFLGKKVGALGKATSSLSSSSSTSSLPVKTPVSSYPRRRGPKVVKTSSSSSSSSSSPPPSPSPLPSPPRRVRRGPVVVKSESESSDVEFIKASKAASIRGKKKKRSESAHIESGEEKKNGVGSKKKKKKKKKRGKQTEVLEPVDEEETPAYIGGEDDEEMVDGVGEESFNSDIERRKRRKEVRRRRKAKELCNDKDVDNDGDVDMQGHESGISKEVKKKRKKPKAIDSGLDLEPPFSEVVPKKRKKSKKGKEKEIPPHSESEELSSLPAKNSKRKRDDQSAPEIEGSESLGENGGDIATWKKRLLEINLARNELFVEERELKAKLLRTQLTARKQKADEGQRFGNFTCSACGEYGHRKDSRVCEKHPGRMGR